MKKFNLSKGIILFGCILLVHQLIAQNDSVLFTGIEDPVIPNKPTTGAVRSELLQSMPFRDLNGIALSSPNTYYLKGGNLITDGLESNGDYFFIDGMQVEDGKDFPYRSVAGFHHYRFGQPIYFGNVAGSLISIESGDYADKLHFEIDGFTTLTKGLKNNSVELNIGGPIRFGKNKPNNKFVPRFYLASNYTFTNDPNPGWEKKVQVTPDNAGYLSENPLRTGEPGYPGTLLNADFLGQNDIEEVPVHQNADRKSLNSFVKLNFPLAKNVYLTLGSYSKIDNGKEFVFHNALINADNNPETFYRNFDNYLNFVHRFDVSENLKISYQVNLQYSNYYYRKQDAVHKDRIFEYGYLGKYSTYKTPAYQLEDYYSAGDSVYQNVYVMNTWDVDTAYTFQNLNYNPEAARFTEQIYQFFPDNQGHWANSDQLQLNGGLLNGQNPQSIYGLWYSQGTTLNGYIYNENEKYRGVFRVNADYKSQHFVAGIEYMNKVQRSYAVNTLGLWQAMRNKVNYHIQELDQSNPQFDRLASNNQIYFYRKYYESIQTNFDKNLRQKLGLPVDGTDFILTDSYDMANNTIDYYDKNGMMHTVSVPENLFTLDMFSPDELLNYGNEYVRTQGYDYYGNKLKGKQDKYGFFNDRTIDAYRPSYLAAFFGDQFRWKSLDVFIGLRIDHFNANQPVLKDPYLLYPAYTAGEVTEINGTPVTHPSNIGGDYVVYVDNPVYPTGITGYRDGSTWYDGIGSEITDPGLLDAGSGIAPYLVDPDQNELTPDVFTDYKSETSFLPQINLYQSTQYGDIYFNYNTFTQNPVAYNIFRPDQYYFLRNIPGIINNPALKPMKTGKVNIGVRPKIYKTLYADISYLFVYVKNLSYIDTLIGAYPANYVTMANNDDLLQTNNVTAAINYFSPKSSGISAGSAFTKSFISEKDRYYMNIADVVINTHLTFNFGRGRDFILPGKKTLKSIFENFAIGIFHQHRSGTKLPNIEHTARNYNYAPDIDILNLRIEKGFYIKPVKTTASLYILVENLLNRENLFYINPMTGKPDDNGYLTDPNRQGEINATVNPDTFWMLYQYRQMDPSYYDIPRIFQVGLIVRM